MPHMFEVDPAILRAAVGGNGNSNIRSSGVIVVDSLEGCLKESGEIIAAELRPDQLVELGELIMIRRAEKREVEMGGEEDPGLRRWLVEGDVVYKSVGIGVMDLCVGMDVVKLASERGIGTTVDGF
jgi:ornithine cyclodeaminase/alanine dehydrogenase-like protein (mu-crystallin family)